MSEDAQKEFAQKVRLLEIEYFSHQGKEIFKGVSEAGVFNHKLLGTLSAGAILAILTYMTRKEGDAEILKILIHYLPQYLGILFITVLNAALLYIHTYALAEHFEHELDQLAKGLYDPHRMVKTRSRSKLVSTLNIVLITLHAAAVIWFFLASFCLTQTIIQNI